MKKIIAMCLLITTLVVNGQTEKYFYSKQVANTVMHIWKDSFALGSTARWSYDMGVILKAFENIWQNTGDVQYFNYIKKQMDFYVSDDGKQIKTYRPDEYNIDHINNGKLLLTLYRVTQQKKYLTAAQLLNLQLQSHPRTKEGSFWHKKIYPNQVWLDGLYMGQPFYAEYAMLSGNDTAFNDIANQFLRIEQQARDTKTGLLYHAYDESKQMGWANKTTGLSPHFWARAMGWYATAIVDVLDYFPQNHPKRNAIIGILDRLSDALKAQQDPATGLWYDVMNYNGPGKEKNYLEASASSQFVYAIAKGVRKKYLSSNKLAIAQKGYAGLIKQFIKLENGKYNLHGTVKVSGLGGKPYRDGSFEYYMSEQVIVNDPKGLGAFLLASAEMDMHTTNDFLNKKSPTILMDNYFNRESKLDDFGNSIIHHYKWNEKDNGGFYFVNHIFNMYGAQTEMLDKAPKYKNLKKAKAYFIVDADNEKDVKNPNYLAKYDIKAITKFVKKGGILVLLHNDSANAEFVHFNKLSNAFGLHFYQNLRHDVVNNNYEQGKLVLDKPNSIFGNNRTVFIKQLSTHSTLKNEYNIYSENNEVIMSLTPYGKGFVFALGDPWLYNEYVDGRKIPSQFENYAAATDLVKWILSKNK
jgi:unsaturated rhamnogalacturonyl hydrolase